MKRTAYRPLLWRSLLLCLLVGVAVATVLVLKPTHPAHADGNVSLSNQTVVHAGTSCGSLCAWTDGILGVLQNGSSYTFFGSSAGAGNPGHTAVTSGTLDNPAQKIIQNGVQISGVDPSIYKYDTVGPVYQDGAGTIVGFTHLERQPKPCCYDPFWGSLGMSVSKDGGNTWSFCGEIIQHNFPYNTNITDSYEVSSGTYALVNPPDDPNTPYFYVYFSDTTTSGAHGIGVARAKVSDVSGAADSSSCSAPTFHKWNNNGWDSAPAAWLNGTGGAPQGGPFQDILSPSGHYSGNGGEVDIIYDSYIGQYILATNIGTDGSGSGGAYGIGIQMSSNPLNFANAPMHPVLGDASTNAQYPSFVGLGSNPETVAGEQLYLYAIEWPNNQGLYGSTTNLVRTTITVGGPSNSYQASTDFSSTQGQTSWSYQYSTNGDQSFQNQSWDSSWSSWDGPGGYYGFCDVTSNWQIPNTSCDAARVWQAPQSGTVTLSSNGPLSVQTACGGNNSGTQIRILKNGSQIWPASGWQVLAHASSYTFPSGVTTSVATGDRIQFVIATTGSDNWCDVTSWDQVVTYAAQASTNFSSIQGQNSWYYEYSTNGDQSFQALSWDGPDGTWVDPNGVTDYCDIWQNAQHPNASTCDSARVWVAPHAGTVSLSSNGAISVVSPCGGNTSGVNIRILKNGSQIWPSSGWQNIPNGSSYTFPSGVSTTVAAGDHIEFVDAHAGSTNYCDGTTWDQVVTLS